MQLVLLSADEPSIGDCDTGDVDEEDKEGGDGVVMLKFGINIEKLLSTLDE